VDGKAHFSGFGAHPQLIHQLDEVGVSPVVEYDKAGVHSISLAFDAYIDGMGMAADPVAGLEHAAIVFFMQQEAAGQP